MPVMTMRLEGSRSARTATTGERRGENVRGTVGGAALGAVGRGGSCGSRHAPSPTTTPPTPQPTLRARRWGANAGAPSARPARTHGADRALSHSRTKAERPLARARGWCPGPPPARRPQCAARARSVTIGRPPGRRGARRGGACRQPPDRLARPTQPCRPNPAAPPTPLFPPHSPRRAAGRARAPTEGRVLVCSERMVEGSNGGGDEGEKKRRW